MIRFGGEKCYQIKDSALNNALLGVLFDRDVLLHYKDSIKWLESSPVKLDKESLDKVNTDIDSEFFIELMDKLFEVIECYEMERVEYTERVMQNEE